MFWLTTTCTQAPQVGSIYSILHNPYVWVVLEACPTGSPDGWSLTLEKSSDVEEWDGLNWVDWSGPGAPKYRSKYDIGREYFNPLAPSGWVLTDARRTPHWECMHKRINDVGFAAYCLDCDAKMRLVDWEWRRVD